MEEKLSVLHYILKGHFLGVLGANSHAFSPDLAYQWLVQIALGQIPHSPPSRPKNAWAEVAQALGPAQQ